MILYRYRVRSFTLVLTLFLTVMIVVSVGALALTGSVESLAASHHAAQFEHELAVSNFVACFPQLLSAARGTPPDHDGALRFEFSYDSCTIKCLASPEREKLNLGAVIDPQSLTTQLRDLARRNGLPEANVRIRPLTKAFASAIGDRLFWFSQIVQPTEFEEVFPWSFPDPGAEEKPRQKTWSNLVSFWNGQEQNVFSLELETQIGGLSTRRWYLIVFVADQHAKVLYKGTCS